MEISYSADAADIDRAAFDAEAERPGRPVRLRIQPTLLRVTPGQTSGNHRSWQGVSWTLECRNATEAIAVRAALEAFFQALTVHGAGQVERALTQAVPK